MNVTIRTGVRLASLLGVMAVFGGALAIPVSAQLAHASAATLGMAQNQTATARDFGAISVNPAGLAMPGSGFSLAVAPVRFRSGLDPITLADLNEFAGRVVPDATKEAWLERIQADGGQSGTAGLRLTELALTVGNFGVQASTVGLVNLNLAPAVAEALLYGNAGRTGAPADLSFAGSSASGYAVTTLGVSAAFPIPSPEGSMAVGVTGKYIVGHGLLLARDRGGAIQADPIRVEVDFPIVMPREDTDGVSAGSGLGLDVGFMLKRDAFALGASVQNLVNTFEWDAQELAYRPGTASASVDSTATDFDEQPYAAAPSDLRSQVEDMVFKPALAVGIGYDVTETFTVTADLKNRFGDGIALAPKFHAGAGAEFRGLGLLVLRGGAALVTGGYQVAGGASLSLGPVHLSTAAAFRDAEDGATNIVQFALSFGGR